MALPNRSARKRESVYLRVVKGGLEPMSDYYVQMLRARNYHVGDVLRADLSKPRNPKHHALVMALLQRVLENQDGLLTMNQLLTVVKIKLGRASPFIDAASSRTFWVVDSISFDAMDQGEFEVFWSDLCKLIAKDYFPGMAPALVSELATMMGDA